MRFTVLTAIAAVTIAGCTPADSSDPNLIPPAAPATPNNTRTVTYRIGGTATNAKITYSTPSGQEQQNGAHVPWKKTFTIKRGEYTSTVVSARNADGGTITCEISVDGKVTKQAESSGEDAIVSCDVSLGF